MSQIKTLNGVQYTLPQYSDTGWGANTGNVLTQYLAAIADVTLQLSGGAFTLTAEVDFGSNFGLKALYLKSETANPASAGVVRLAKTDSIGWRNNANGADKLLNIDGSDNLQYASTKVLLSGAVVNADINASAAIAYSKLALTGSIVNADIASGAAIAYSKLSLTGSIVNGDLTAGTILNSAINASAAIAHSKMAALSASVVPVTDASGFITSSATTATELGYLHGVTSAIQTQLNATIANPLTSDLAAGGHKVTGLAAASANGDAVRFEQLNLNAAGYVIGTVVQMVQVTDTTSTAASGTSYTSTNVAASITPKATTHKIRVTVTGRVSDTAWNSSNTYVSVFRGVTDLAAAGNGFVGISGNTAVNAEVPVSISYLDSPASTSALTYTVKLKTTSAASGTWNTSGGVCVILLEEIAA